MNYQSPFYYSYYEVLDIFYLIFNYFFSLHIEYFIIN